MADSNTPLAMQTDVANEQQPDAATIEQQAMPQSAIAGSLGDPSQQEPGLEAPMIDPIDLLGGAIGSKLARAIPSAADAIASGLSHTEFGNLVANEIGSIGPGVEKFVVGAGKQIKGFNPLQKLTGVTEELANKAVESNVPQKTYTEVMASRGIAKPQKPMYADGGDVAENEPPGLDSFLAEPHQMSAQPPLDSSHGSQEPQGLNDFLKEDLQQEKYGNLGQQAISGAEGAATGLIGPFAPALEQAAGVNAEDIQGRAEANPWTHGLSEAAGFIAPALLAGPAAGIAKMTQIGALEAIQKKLGLVAGETLASKIGTGAAKATIDNMLLSGSDEVSKMILKDPDQSSQTAIAHIGLSGLLGGVLGGGVAGVAHGVPALWESTVGDKAGKLIHDFKARVNQHLDNPDPVTAMKDELSKYHGDISSVADEVYGPQGIKAQDIAKSMPEMHEGITSQAEGTAAKLDKTIKKMVAKPNSYPPRLVSKLQQDLEDYSGKVTSESTPGEIFNATQDLKQQLQGYAKFDKFVKPVDEAYDFVRDAKSLSHDLRTSLEDTDVWGKAAKRQIEINEAFREYLPALKDFEKKFTTEVAGEKTIDPAKVSTYLNQVGKPNAEIKQQMLQNFLEASEKYKKAIARSHDSLGIEAPAMNSPMNVTLNSLEKKTLGSKLADAFINKGLTEAGSSAAGAGVGATLAHAAGLHGGVGALIGHAALTPFFKSVLPALARSLVSGEVSPQGFKAAVDYGLNVAKGEALLEKATSSIFKVDKEALPTSSYPSEKERANLIKKLDMINEHPDQTLNKVNPNQAYLPDHASSQDQTIGNAVSYLNSIRPDLAKQAPLDSKPIASPVQQAEFNNALNLAQQPTLILDKLKRGTMTQKDLTTVSTLYPALLKNMQQKLGNSLNDHLTKGYSIPYRTKMGLSMFMGQPLDSTLSQSSIAAMQPMAAAQPSSPPAQGKQGKGVKSAPALQKMPQLFQTHSQSRSIRANKN